MMGTRPRLLVIDNYDSFTYNLVQGFGLLGADVVVHRNDEISVGAALTLQPTHLLLSPGPGRPESSGVTLPLLRAALGRLPILGVCLGHQALALSCGGRIVAARQLRHGKASRIDHDGRGLFAGLPQPMTVGRYHSLAVDRASIPAALEISAETSDGEVMGLRHRSAQAFGVQFHPESILSPDGMALMKNFLRVGD